MSEKRSKFKEWLDGNYSLYDDSKAPLLLMDELSEAEKQEQKDTKIIGKKPGTIYLKILVFVLALLIFAELMLLCFALAPFGSADAPVFNSVTERYVFKSAEETGATNSIAAMIMDYRAFDTLGESFVLFTAFVLVLMLREKSVSQIAKKTGLERATRDRLFYETIRLTGPFVLLFSVYVILNGHKSPGGGFSGGSILGTLLILISAAVGDAKLSNIFSSERLAFASGLALLTYLLLKGVFFLSANIAPELAYLPLKPGSIFGAGLILPLNICVGIVVACTFLSIYSIFAKVQREEKT